MKYDLIILGGGPAGYLAAERAGHAGLRALCVEERSLGGVCLNEGCIPTKALLYSAKLYEGAKYGEKYGVQAGEIALDHKKVLARKGKVVKTLVAGVRAALKATGAETVMARGVIAGKAEGGFLVEAGGERYAGERLLIATGSSPVLPPIPGLREGIAGGFVLTNREALELQDVPQRLAVIGGGVIGLEMASYYRAAGAEVTVVEMLDHIAGENDAELVAILRRGMEKKGIRFVLGAKVTEITAGGLKYEQHDGNEALEADKVLLSIGRRANIEGIGLDTLGVHTERGAIVTDGHMRTNVPGVYAPGDVNGRSMLAHTAYREAEVAVNDMLGKRDAMRYNAIPAVLYTNPELSGVGETEATALAKGMDIEVVKLPMRFSGRYLAENEGGDGICKLIRDKKKGTLIGAQALANYSSEFIVAAGTFIEQEMSIEQIRRIVFPHPAVAEILREGVWQFEITS